MQFTYIYFIKVIIKAYIIRKIFNYLIIKNYKSLMNKRKNNKKVKSEEEAPIIKKKS